MFKRRHFGPLSFWFLNHRLRKPELARQMDELKAKGFSGFFMHPRDGLLTPYGSEEWHAVVSFCVAHARKIGLEAWLYDEDPFPSGVAGGRVVFDHPEYQASHLRHKVLTIQRPGHYELDLPRGALVGAFLVQGGQITRIDQHAGFVRTNWKSGLNHHSYYPPYAAEGNPCWRAGTSDPFYRISLVVDRTPAILMGFIRQPINAGPWGVFTDLLNREAVGYFIKCTHREYHRRLSREFGRTIPGIFMDEPKVIGALPWSESLEPCFRSLTGRSLVASLPHLVYPVDENSVFLRWAYREAIAGTFKTAFVGQIESFCRKNRLALTGHISPEEDPIGQAYLTPGLMNCIGHLTLPGTDIVGALIGDVQHPLLHLSPKLASSAAHTRGKTHVLCEALAVCDWSQDLAFMGKTVNWLYALGVNTLVTHGQFYSIDGLRKREAPPSQFIPAAYWNHFEAFSRYVECLSKDLTQGYHAAPLLLYYPSEAFMALTDGRDYWEIHNDRRPEAIKTLRDQLAGLMDLLLTHGYDFDLVDAEALADARIVKGDIHLRRETYAGLVVPDCWLRPDAAKKLRGIAKHGARIVALAKKMPVIGGGHFEVRNATTMTSLLADLRRWCRPVFQAGGRLIGHKRVTKKGAVLFLCNNSEKLFSGTVKPDFAGPYQIKDMQTRQLSAPVANLNLKIPPGRAMLIQTAQSSADVRCPKEWKPCLDLSHGWIARAESDNCLILNEFHVQPCRQDSIKIDDAKLRGALRPEDFLAGTLVDLLAPQPKTSARVLTRRNLYATSFEIRDWRGPLYLVRDTQLGPPADHEHSDTFRFFINGHELKGLRNSHRYDCYNLEVRIDPWVREGRNFLIMLQELPDDVPVEKGLPFDAVRLFGPFHVEFPYGRPMPALLTPRPKKYDIGLPLGPQELGHAQYGGIFTYSRRIHVAEAPARTAIRFAKLHETAEIKVNGRQAGILWQEPHFLEIDPRLWKHGENLIEVACATSPANYLQGLRRPGGFTGQVEWCR